MKSYICLTLLFAFSLSQQPYKLGILKKGGSTECPTGYKKIMDQAECLKVGKGRCLSPSKDECQVWSKRTVNKGFFAKNFGDGNQLGCSFDQDSGVIFNTRSNWSGKHNEDNDRPVCKVDDSPTGYFSTYKIGIKKESGSTECPTGYKPIMDQAECLKVGKGPCLSSSTDECQVWSKRTGKKESFAKNFGDGNQLGCSYDHDDGVIFNTRSEWSGKHNEKNDRPVCRKLSRELSGESKIVNMLRELIDEARKEILVVKAEVVAAEGIKNETGIELTDAIGQEGAAKDVRDDAATDLSEAKGVVSATKKQYSDNVPDLETEIALFNDIIDRLKDLSVTDKDVNVTGEDFVEDKEVNVTAFISFVGDQADQDKVRKVVGLLQNLIDAAKTEIVMMKKVRDDAQVLFELAEAALAKADGVWSAANALTKTKQTAFKKAEEAFNVAKNHAIERVKVLNEEIDSLDKAILLIKDLEE